jgi:hypothetical protein
MLKPAQVGYTHTHVAPSLTIFQVFQALRNKGFRIENQPLGPIKDLFRRISVCPAMLQAMVFCEDFPVPRQSSCLRPSAPSRTFPLVALATCIDLVGARVASSAEFK